MIERTILRNLIQNEAFTRAVLPYIKEEYFNDADDREAFKQVRNFILKYNARPTFEALRIEIDGVKSMDAETSKKVGVMIDQMEADTSLPPNYPWLLDTTEKFCQDRSLYLALVESVKIANNNSSGVSKGAIPTILAEALSISFDPEVGHDYTEDFDFRYEYYHKIESRIPFDIELFNTATKGGIPPKTLNICIGQTGQGKSLFLCHFAASYLAQGKNVLYITLELAEEEIGKRIDANLLNVTFDTLQSMDKDEYDAAFGKLKSKTQGRLFIKEYPTATASATNFKALLNELKLKKRFKPDVVIVDYLNICASARIKSGSDANSYTYVKSIAEELRGFAVENEVVLWSATQTNRSGLGNSDAGLENTADSIGLPATADFMFLIYAGEELQELGQIMVKQLKSRYNDISKLERFNVGVDKSKMKLYDVDDVGQYGSIVSAYQNRPAATQLKKFKNTP
jgi:KaiC/GvpD/RAD55 family RecA-like ATPase